MKRLRKKFKEDLNKFIKKRIRLTRKWVLFTNKTNIESH